MQRFHFISGLPRAGSTLLSAILRQNPRFSAGMTSPVSSLFEAVVERVSAGSEMGPLVDRDTRERLLRGLFTSYYEANDAEVIFDTSRAWTAKLPALMSIFPEAKVICLVRNVAWIMDSVERQFRHNGFENTRLFSSAAERATVYSRVEALAQQSRMVGFPWHALKEACWSEYADRLVLIDYDLLAERPAEVVGLLYKFLGETPFAHDFERVDYDAPGFDLELGVDGLHRVSGRVEPKPRKSILPPDLFERYSNLAFWQSMPGSAAFKIVPKSTSAQPAADLSAAATA